MKSDRSYIIWVPRNASDKSHHFLISPFFIIIMSLLLFLCICSVPALETWLLNLQSRVAHLEQKKHDLVEEVLSLEYIKEALARMEEKDRALRGYFGMEGYGSLEQIIGAGGIPGVKDLSEIDKELTEPDDYFSKTLDDHNTDLPLKLEILDSNNVILNKLIIEKEKISRHTPNIMPVELDQSVISSGFGWRISPFTGRKEFHIGIDIIGKKGTKIIAPASGVVINSGYDQWLGNFIVVKHTEEIKTIYGHLSKISAGTGKSVNRGDTLGFMGNSGLSTGNHLHYAVIKNDRAVNPMEYILDKEVVNAPEEIVL